MKLRHVLLALALAVPMVATAQDIPMMLAKVDQLMASEAKKLDEETMKEVKALRDDGEKAHKDGKDDKAQENLNQALLLLGGL